MYARIVTYWIMLTHARGFGLKRYGPYSRLPDGLLGTQFPDIPENR